jgi:hypothetical protein
MDPDHPMRSVAACMPLKWFTHVHLTQRGTATRLTVKSIMKEA